MADVAIAFACPDCGRPYPPHEGMLPELQGCGRLAVPVAHMAKCVATDDRGGFIVKWTNPSPRPPRAHDDTLPQVGSFHG